MRLTISTLVEEALGRVSMSMSLEGVWARLSTISLEEGCSRLSTSLSVEVWARLSTISLEEGWASLSTSLSVEVWARLSTISLEEGRSRLSTAFSVEAWGRLSTTSGCASGVSWSSVGLYPIHPGRVTVPCCKSIHFMSLCEKLKKKDFHTNYSKYISTQIIQNTFHEFIRGL